MTLKDFKRLIKSLEDSGKINDDTNLCIYKDDSEELIELNSNDIITKTSNYINDLENLKSYYHSLYRYNPKLLNFEISIINSKIDKIKSLGDVVIILNKINNYDT